MPAVLIQSLAVFGLGSALALNTVSCHVADPNVNSISKGPTGRAAPGSNPPAGGPSYGGVGGSGGSSGGSSSGGSSGGGGSGGTGPSSSGGPTNGDLPPAASISSSQTAPSAPHVSDWQRYVSREPMWFINPWHALRDSPVHPEDNISGLAEWWRGDRAVDRLIGQIERGYGFGARWFFVNRPMGTLGYTHVPGGSWLPINAEKRAEIVDKLNSAMLDHFDEPVNIVWFVGSDLTDPRSLVGWTPSRADEFYQIGETESWDRQVAARATIGGWLSTGASGISIDHASPMDERGHFIDLFHQLIRPPFHMTVIGEAYPLERQADGRPVRQSDGSMKLSMPDMEKMPWVATHDLLTERWPTSFGPGQRGLDPSRTRAFVWMANYALNYGQPNERKALIRSWLGRGLIPITNDPVMFREALDWNLSHPVP